MLFPLSAILCPTLIFARACSLALTWFFSSSHWPHSDTLSGLWVFLVFWASIVWCHGTWKSRIAIEDCRINCTVLLRGHVWQVSTPSVRSGGPLSAKTHLGFPGHVFALPPQVVASFPDLISKAYEFVMNLMLLAEKWITHLQSRWTLELRQHSWALPGCTLHRPYQDPDSRHHSACAGYRCTESGLFHES